MGLGSEFCYKVDCEIVKMVQNNTVGAEGQIIQLNAVSGIKKSGINASACIVYSFTKPSLTWIQSQIQNENNVFFKKQKQNKKLKYNKQNNVICAMFYSTVYPALKAIFPTI